MLQQYATTVSNVSLWLPKNTGLQVFSHCSFGSEHPLRSDRASATGRFPGLAVGLGTGWYLVMVVRIPESERQPFNDVNSQASPIGSKAWSLLSGHWMSNVAYTSQENAAPVGAGSGVWLRKLHWWLLGDLVRALPGVSLRRLDLLRSLAAEDADETPHGVLLTARGGYDLTQRRASGAFQQRDDFDLLVACVRLRFASHPLRLVRLLRRLGFLGSRAPTFRLRSACVRRFLSIDCIRTHSVPPGPGCGRHFHHSGSETFGRNRCRSAHEPLSARDRSGQLAPWCSFLLARKNGSRKDRETELMQPSEL